MIVLYLKNAETSVNTEFEETAIFKLKRNVVA